jgi:trimeric autotransporter adhesin
MKTKLIITLGVLIVAAVKGRTAPNGTEFTYQGRLTDATGPPAGAYDFSFALHQGASGGAAIVTVTNLNVPVSNGLFIASVDFGAVFDGSARWIEIAVRPGASTGNFTVLNPRQPLTATPYALYAMTPAGPQGTQGVAGATGPAGPQGIPGSANGWSRTGNSATTPGTDFIGTTDNQPLEIKVNGRRAIQFKDVIDGANNRTVNILAGAASNFIEPGVTGATIAGGGQDSNDGLHVPNDIRGHFGFIGGGSGNYIDAFIYSVIGGGTGNNAQGGYSTIAGGAGNNTQSDYTTIGGGQNNFAFGTHGTVAGGFQNSISSGNYSTVGGGSQNTANGHTSTIGGGSYNATTEAATTVGGGMENSAKSPWATIAGGFQNIATGQYSSIAGGAQNNNGSFLAAIGGGSQNTISSGGQYAAIGGGSRNSLNGDTAVIGGGDQNTVNGTFTTIAGGKLNYGWSVSDFSAIGGGYANTVYGDYATVPGGYRNYADGLASFAGGYRAYAAHDGSFVWADAHEQDFTSTAANQFCIRATGGIVFESFGNIAFYSGVGTTEANRYFLLLNSPGAPSASGLKAGGILCADSFNYANPGKNNMVVKGTLGVGYPDPAPYTMAVNGNIYSLGGYASSDVRRKRNIEPLAHALDVVLKLRGVSFAWRRDEFPDLNLNEGRQVGLIAQEVEQVLPEVVSTDAKGYKAVAYQNIVPVLVEAIKEQQKTIDELQAKVSVMQHLAAEIESIKARLTER